jgi:hypothetical protein
MKRYEGPMQSVWWTAILCALTVGCEAKQEHGFIAVGGETGPVGGSAGLTAWGSCGAELPAELDSDAVVQVVPPPGARNVSVHTPIIAFLEEGYTLDDIDHFDVSSNGWGIDGDLVTIERTASTAIGFAPLDPYDVAGEVLITMEIMGGEVEWQFHTGPYEDTVAGNPNLSFENAATAQGIECEYTYFTDNFIGFGDVAFTAEEAGATGATDGESRLLMTTGEVLGNASVRATTSFVTSQPLPVVTAPNLSLDYRFVSEEFDENIGPIHDDSFLIMAHGQNGVVFEEITSVNRIGAADSTDIDFPGLVGAEASEWRTHTLTGFNTVGSDATITIFLTDVGSTVRTSAVSVDNLRVE